VAKALGVPEEPQPRRWPLWAAWLTLALSVLFLAFVWWEVIRD
jgi:hypothetical protein